jgi:phosphoglucosamine mutase
MKLFGTSGIRAVFNKDLVDLAFRVGIVLGRDYRNVVVGTDTRTSGDVMKHAVISGLLASGAGCRDAGIAPTPTIAFATREFDAGVMITASHNPPEYNGIKLLNPDGSSFTSSQQAQMEEVLSAGSFDTASWQDVRRCEIYENAIERHIEGLLSHFPHSLNLKVVVDAGCGAASGVTPRLLEKLGCEVVTMNCHNSGFFPRPVEPIEANLEDLKKKVREVGAEVGIAHDGDADRMMAVDEIGEFIPGDALLAIFSRDTGARDMVTTLDASMSIEEMGFDVKRTPIGDTYVSEELRNGGDFGGETSGSWIFPEISLCPDGIYAAARIVLIAGRQKLSELVKSVPSYPLLRGSIKTDGVNMAGLESVLMALNPSSVSRIDGLKLDFEDGWLLVRPSGTEPKIRLTAEARTESRVHHLYEDGLKAVNDYIVNKGSTN